MNLFNKIFKINKYEVEPYIIKEIEITLTLLKILNAKKISKSSINQIIETENLFEENFRKILTILRKSKYLHLYWQDIYDIAIQIKNIFSLLNSLYNKCIILKPKMKFNLFFQPEVKIFINLKSYFQKYLHNYIYVLELVKNNNYEIKNFYKSYLELEKSIKFDSFDSMKLFDILLVLEKINKSNDKIQNLLNKILIMVNI